MMVALIQSLPVWATVIAVIGLVVAWLISSLAVGGAAASCQSHQSAKLLIRDEARRIGANVAKLPKPSH